MYKIKKMNVRSYKKYKLTFKIPRPFILRNKLILYNIFFLQLRKLYFLEPI